MQATNRELKADTQHQPRPTFKERMDADIQRVTQSLVNLLQRRYGDAWREKLAEIVR